jgi:hypothetical protein
MSEWTTRCVVSIVMILAIVAGAYFTHDANCFWALFLPFWLIQKAN